ncbi:MAG TPA: hypothetical protein VJ756_10750, partial [Terriglobales bacterium]|nr:hypothetical protein [Terriglobales bacterium]
MKKKNYTSLVAFSLFLLAVTSLASELPIKTKILPLDQVHAGMHGVAYTVFQGTTPVYSTLGPCRRTRMTSPLGP